MTLDRVVTADASSLRAAIRAGAISAPSASFDLAVERIYTIERYTERRGVSAS